MHFGCCTQISGYPTVKFFPAGVKSSSNVQDYEGGRVAADIVAYALDQLTANVEPPEVFQVHEARVYYFLLCMIFCFYFVFVIHVLYSLCVYVL